MTTREEISRLIDCRLDVTKVILRQLTPDDNREVLENHLAILTALSYLVSHQSEQAWRNHEYEQAEPVK